MQIAINECLLTNKTNIPNNIIIFKNLADIPKHNTFFFSQKYDCQYLSTEMYGIVRYFNLTILDWLPFVKDLYINFDGCFKLSCQLNSNDIGKFCISNNINSDFQSQIIKNKYDLKFIQEQFQEDSLLLITEQKIISQKIRFWIIDEQIIEYSKFSNTDETYKYSIDTYIKFVNNTIKYYQPDEVFTIDIGLYNNNLTIINYHCFSTSEFLYANIEKICNSLKIFFKI